MPCLTVVRGIQTRKSNSYETTVKKIYKICPYGTMKIETQLNG